MLNLAALPLNDYRPEQWRPIPGYEGLYEVSDHGRVKSYARYATGRILSGDKQATYLQVGLRKDGETTTYLVHRLVMAAFVGPDDRWVNHRDGDKRNNRLSNLEYVTPSENAEHARRMGFVGPRRRQAAQTPHTKLGVVEAAPDVRLLADVIRREHRAGFRQREIARRNGVSQSTVSRVVRGQWWA